MDNSFQEMTKKKSKGWVVMVRCEVVKELVCDYCSKQDAEDDPFAHAIQERECGTPDWEVISIVPNE